VRFEEKRRTRPKHAAPLLELATVLLGCNNAHLVEEEGEMENRRRSHRRRACSRPALKAGGNRERLEQELPKHHEIPFDSDRKRSTVIRKMPDGKLRAFINGAPDRCWNAAPTSYTSTASAP
jgi:Ca2+-transporting ATPase